MRVVPGQPGEIANRQDSNTSNFGHRHPVPHAILSENQASPSACRLLLWQPEELLQVGRNSNSPPRAGESVPC